MKKILVIIALSLFLISNTAFAADLLGTWEVEGECLRLGDPHVVGDQKPLGDPMVITHHEDGLFEGYTCGVEYPNARFFGAVKEKNIYITQWDAVVVGTINNQMNYMEAVTQHQQFNPGSSPATCLAEATKVSNVATCCPYWANSYVFLDLDGNCFHECQENFSDCDGDPDNGCEYGGPNCPSLPN